jgi:flagellar assembly protein FliH
VAERPIIARATPAGVRRLRAGPPPPAGEPPRPAEALGARPSTGLNAFLESARRQGAELVAVAREQAQTIAQSAREEGFAAGYAEGTARAERATADLLSHAETMARDVARYRDEAYASCERELVELALAVAGKVVQRAIELEPERVVDVLRGALRKTFSREGLTVVCSPDDLARLQAAGPELSGALGGLQDLQLHGDRRIAPGGVVVRTPIGDIDGTIASQLDRLAGLLLEAPPRGELDGER